MEFLPVIGICVAAYLIGSIPFGLIVGKLAGIGDIRNVGSGNIGATNMVRAGGKKLGALVLILDMGKGLLATGLANYYGCYSVNIALLEATQQCPPNIEVCDFTCLATSVLFLDRFQYWLFFSLLAGLFAVIGHMFPLWLKFKGGKGVATTIGVCFGVAVTVGQFVIAAWLIIFLLTRYSSLAAIIAIGATPIFYFIRETVFFHDWQFDYISRNFSWGQGPDLPYILFFFIISALVIFKHRDNIRRLRSGTESRFSFGGKKE